MNRARQKALLVLFIEEEYLCFVQDVAFKPPMTSNSAGNAARIYTGRARG